MAVLLGGSPLLAVATADRLILTSDKLVLSLANPLLDSWDVNLRESPVWYESNGHRGFARGLRSVECNLSFACGDCRQEQSLPTDLRLADDMTVRELLAAVNRKLMKRET